MTQNEIARTSACASVALGRGLEAMGELGHRRPVVVEKLLAVGIHAHL